MSISPREIDAIVNVVVERLREGAARTSIVDENPPTQESSGATLRLSSKLITLDTLREKLPTLECLIVDHRAIITPSVKDALKDQGVQLVREDLRSVHVDSEKNYAGRRDQLLVVADLHLQSKLGQLGRFQVASQSVAENVLHIQEFLKSGCNKVLWSAAKPYAATNELHRSQSKNVLMLPSVQEWNRARLEVDPSVVLVDALSWTADATCEIARRILEALI